MNPVVIGNAMLYLGDCREILPRLHRLTVGSVVTDPPYGMNYVSGYATDALWAAGKTISGDRNAEVRDETLCKIDEIWPYLPRLVFGTWKVTRPPQTKIVLIWDKGGALGMGDLALPWKPDHEEIYVMGSGFVGSRDCGSVIHCPPVQSMAKNGREHPNEKPVRLMRELIRKTEGTILDPFMGSGSTGVAAIQMGRSFVGIEMQPAFFDIACRRIEEAQKQAALFPHEESRKPTQDGLFAQVETA